MSWPASRSTRAGRSSGRCAVRRMPVCCVTLREMFFVHWFRCARSCRDRCGGRIDHRSGRYPGHLLGHCRSAALVGSRHGLRGFRRYAGDQHNKTAVGGSRFFTASATQRTRTHPDVVQLDGVDGSSQIGPDCVPGVKGCRQQAHAGAGNGSPAGGYRRGRRASRLGAYRHGRSPGRCFRAGQRPPVSCRSRTPVSSGIFTGLTTCRGEKTRDVQ